MISLEAVSARFSRGLPNEVHALDAVSLAIGTGDFVMVIGSNGSGKSTLLNVIAGSIKADDGIVIIDGDDVTAWASHRRAGKVARVFQNPFSGTAPSMTVLENLRLASLRGHPKGLRVGLKDDVRTALVNRLEDLGLGLETRLDTPAGRLSGGERQALTLLMATLGEPRLLLLDEHTAALDPRSADRVMHLTATLVARYHLTVLMVTHDLDQAASFGSRLVVLQEGHVAADFTSERKQQLTPEMMLSWFRR